ncbi:MAG: adenylate/guanylate cyclase domain-containing protein [Acidiferrobacterales bacterium]
MASKTSQLAIMFADISGSTRLYETLGDVRAQRKVSKCLDMMSETIEKHAGVVVKTIGDEVMSTFWQPERAVIAAREMQKILAEDASRNEVDGKRSLSICVGLHYGPAIIESGDVFGDAVNLAAHIAAQAKAEQIITTQVTVENLSPSMQTKTRLIDRVSIKGKKKDIDLYEVLWHDEEITQLVTGVIEAQTPNVKLYLRYRDREIELNNDRPSALLGRDNTVDLQINEMLASRQHVRFELSRGKFFIIDQSTNGTHVRIENGQDLFLRREEMPLNDNGMISLGRPFTENPVEVVHFTHESCETSGHNAFPDRSSTPLEPDQSNDSELAEARTLRKHGRTHRQRR